MSLTLPPRASSTVSPVGGRFRSDREECVAQVGYASPSVPVDISLHPSHCQFGAIVHEIGLRRVLGLVRSRCERKGVTELLGVVPRVRGVVPRVLGVVPRVLGGGPQGTRGGPY